jgi:hypothetical protein
MAIKQKMGQVRKRHLNLVKQLIVFSVLLMFLSGCAIVGGSMWGGISTNITVPYQITANTVGKKVGIGHYKSVLGITLKGDCSVEKLTKEAGITRVSHIDYQSKTFMTFSAKATIYVYGE